MQPRDIKRANDIGTGVIGRNTKERIMKNLANVRRKLKLTQKEAAEITGGGPNAFSRYEHGTERSLWQR